MDVSLRFQLCSCGLIVSTNPEDMKIHVAKGVHRMIFNRQKRCKETKIMRCICTLLFCSYDKIKHEASYNHKTNLERMTLMGI